MQKDPTIKVCTSDTGVSCIRTGMRPRHVEFIYCSEGDTEFYRLPVADFQENYPHESDENVIDAANFLLANSLKMSQNAKAVLRELISKLEPTKETSMSVTQKSAATKTGKAAPKATTKAKAVSAKGGDKTTQQPKVSAKVKAAVEKATAPKVEKKAAPTKRSSEFSGKTISKGSGDPKALLRPDSLREALYNGALKAGAVDKFVGTVVKAAGDKELKVSTVDIRFLIDKKLIKVS